MVADDEVSRAVWLGKDGAAATMKAGSLAIECSTVSHQHALDMARDFAGASFTSALRHKDAVYAVKLAESLLADAPLVGRAAVEAYARAKAEMPDDEGRMIEIVSRPK
jgi:3-hydroxyisobutyrate dehydrogenase-like beta-hydroxyacid dehydrogenase